MLLATQKKNLMPTPGSVKTHLYYFNICNYVANIEIIINFDLLKQSGTNTTGTGKRN